MCTSLIKCASTALFSMRRIRCICAINFADFFEVKNSEKIFDDEIKCDASNASTLTITVIINIIFCQQSKHKVF